MDRKRQRASRSRKPREAKGSETQAALLRQALDWFADGCDFTGVMLHGNVGWRPIQLVALAVLWTWSDRTTLTAGF